MQLDVIMDFMHISLRKTVSITLHAGSQRRWTGKFAGFESGELEQTEGGENIRYEVKGNPFATSGLDFYLGNQILCQFRSPFFSRSYVLVNDKRFEFGLDNYHAGHEPGLVGVTFLRGFDGWVGDVRFRSETCHESELLAFGLVAMNFEYLNHTG
ncbi:MAG: hypothetical protein ACKO2G_06240 [Verrucomicrobiales bacterium]